MYNKLFKGNPGVVTFYRHFMEYIYKHSGVPVIGFSHAGQIQNGIETFSGTLFTNFCSRLILCYNILPGVVTVKKQIEHKLEIIEKYIPSNVHLIFLSHSIGSTINLQLIRMLKHREQAAHSFLLFPAIERMGVLPQAKKMLRFFHIRYLFLLVVFALSALKRSWKSSLFNIIDPDATKKAHACYEEAVLELVNWRVMRNVMDMAQDEFKQVQELDDRLIGDNLSRLSFIYSDNDNWAPMSYYEDMKKQFSDGDFELVNHPHAFVSTIASTESVADLVLLRLSNLKLKK